MRDASIFSRALDLTPLHGRRRGLVQCPFHDDRSPSLSVDLDAGIFCCHGCSARGGVNEFTRRWQLLTGELSYREGVRQARRHEPWHRDLAETQTWCRRERQWIDATRRDATATPAGWALLEEAAARERLLWSVQAEIDGAMGW